MLPASSTPESLFGAHITPETLDHQLPAARRFLDSLDGTKQRQFDYLHVLLPHAPWHLLPDGRSYTDELAVPGAGEVWGESSVVTVAHQRYLLQLQATDHLLGEIVARLRALGVYDESLVVVTADHGQAFTPEQPLRKATSVTYPEVMWIPLFVKAPGQAQGTIDDRPAGLIDVMPTIAEMVGAAVPWTVDGRSLLGPPREDGPRRLIEVGTGFAGLVVSEVNYETWDGPSGFARVLASPPVPAGDDDALRIYRGFSQFGDLVGRPAAPLVRRGDSGIEARITEPSIYKDVDLDSPTAPWTYLRVSLTSGAEREFAITVNGVVAAIATGQRNPFTDDASLDAVLPPSLFRNGRNRIDVYTVDGTPRTLRLLAVPRVG